MLTVLNTHSGRFSKKKKLDDSNDNVSMLAKQHQIKQNDVVLLSDKGNDAV